VVPSYYPMLALMLAKGMTATDCFKLPVGNAGVTFDKLKSPQGREHLSFRIGKAIESIAWDQFDRQLEAIERAGVQVITWLDRDYPACLDNIAKRPPFLFCRGDTGILGRRGVAIVGTRKASLRGLETAGELAADLAGMGITVVSGAARGIDSAAHRGALSRKGATVAVIGTGIDVAYPEQNAELFSTIARRGCLVSEQLMGTPPLAYVFPLRNRLISAFSHAVIVIEAARKSGALITVKWALEQGRDVGAVPGAPGDPRSQGVNALLKQGAFLVEGVADILEAVPLLDDSRTVSVTVPGEGEAAQPDGKRDSRLTGLSRDALLVLGLLGPSPVDADSVATGLGRAVAVVQPALLELQMRGLVDRDTVGRYFLV